jgi:hypothetical protein
MEAFFEAHHENRITQIHFSNAVGFFFGLIFLSIFIGYLLFG